MEVEAAIVTEIDWLIDKRQAMVEFVWFVSSCSDMCNKKELRKAEPQVGQESGVSVKRNVKSP